MGQAHYSARQKDETSTHLSLLLADGEAKGCTAITHDGEQQDHHLNCCHPPREVRPVVVHLIQLLLHLWMVASVTLEGSLCLCNHQHKDKKFKDKLCQTYCLHNATILIMVITYSNYFYLHPSLSSRSPWSSAQRLFQGPLCHTVFGQSYQSSCPRFDSRYVSDRYEHWTARWHPQSPRPGTASAACHFEHLGGTFLLIPEATHRDKAIPSALLTNDGLIFLNLDVNLCLWPTLIFKS